MISNPAFAPNASQDSEPRSLQRVAGLSHAAGMFFTGHRYTANKVLPIGLVIRVVPDEELLAQARALADSIAATPAHALRLSKRLLREAQTQGISEVLELSAAYTALARETSYHAEALDTFLEKRTPVFRGE